MTAWPLDAGRFVPGHGMTAADLILLAAAWNHLVRIRHSDRLARTARGAIARADPVYSVDAYTVAAMPPADDFDMLGFALDAAADGGDVDVLVLGEVSVAILDLDPEDWLGGWEDGEPLVGWQEKGDDGVKRRYVAPKSVYERRRRRRKRTPDRNQELGRVEQPWVPPLDPRARGPGHFRWWLSL